MSLLHRKALTAVGFTAAAVASTALFAMPAQAASAGAAKVVGSSTVQFNALLGKSNGLTITISGRTVTLNDKVAIKAGKGCKAVKGDKTKVKCTTKKKTTKLSVALGDKNDWVKNKTSVYMLADGGSGTDTLTGGSGKDQLQGDTGNDKLYGNGGIDTLFGESGNDSLVGGTGNDRIDAGSGADKAWGESGNDEMVGGTGQDRMVGGTGNDKIAGGNDLDTVYGDNGNDVLYGDNGNDFLSGGAGNDELWGDAGNDKIAGYAGVDIILGNAGNDTLTGGDDDDTVIGMAGNDTIAGSAGDDVLAGEDVDDMGQVGSDSALDKLDGGANRTVEGDGCLVMASGTTVNCEYGTITSASRTSAATAQSAAVQAVLDAKARAITARPAV
jgi:Ca2+-binding RTX toxin-like protein